MFVGVAARGDREGLSVRDGRVSERGVALIVTLAILAMLTVLLVAFVGSVRVERLSTKAFSDQLKARLAAQMAVEQAMVDLRKGMSLATPDYTTTLSTNLLLGGTLTNFYTYLGTNSGYQLFSVNPISGTWMDLGASMKAYGLTYPSNGVPRIMVPWVYYTNSYATGSVVSVIRGMIRYAYWVDDESSKININTAGSAAKPTAYDASAVDLRGLIQVDTSTANTITNSRTPPFPTVAALGSVSGFDFTKVFSQGAGFFATVWTAETERQTNGRLRVNINDPSFTNVAAGTAVTNLFNSICANSPGVNGLSNKFGATLWQLCANIRDQLDADRLPTDSGTDPWVTPVYLGIENVPYLNEFALDSVATVTQDTSNFVVAVTNTVVWEVFNLWQTPYAYSTNVVFCHLIPPVLLTWDGATASSTNLAFGEASMNAPLNMSAYSYAVFTNMLGSPPIYIPTNSSLSKLTVRFANGGAMTNLWGATNSGAFFRYQLALLQNRVQKDETVNLTVGMSMTLATNSYSASVSSPGDPRVPGADWSRGTVRTLGGENGTFTPSTAGDGNNDNLPTRPLTQDGGFPFVGGAFPSAGFMGVVSYPTNAWKTLKMYGDGYSNNTMVADWALLDIFTANPVGPGLRTAGKVNVNTLRDLVANTTQEGALAALLMDMQVNPSGKLTYGGTTLQAVVTNIMSGVPYTSIGDFASRVGCFTNPPGINTDTDWRREAVIRAIANNVTVRGSQFSIWALGQNISIVRGQTNVLGEAMAQAVVDRVELTDSISVTGVTWRVRFFRFLND